MSTLIGIEAGGTKFICAHGTGPNNLTDRVRIDTTTPAETMPQVEAYIRQVAASHTVDAIGVACFGPLDLDPLSPQYGSIASTPKLAWKQFPMLSHLKSMFSLPIGFDTDVNAAALGEQQFGVAQDVDSLIYITVGTGIGVGAIVANRVLHGAMHPEAGHMRVPQQAGDDFAGICPYHGNCLEGLASGPAIKARWNVTSALDLAEGHAAWQLESDYLAAAIHNYTLCYAPKRVVLGGGVMRHHALLPLVQHKVITSLAGYVDHAYLAAPDYVVRAGLGDNAGIVGALALAQQAAINYQNH
mgnify:CR=1 FL=1